MEKYLISKDEGEPRVFKVSSVSTFVELVNWLYSDKRVIFRGQRKGKGRPLSPSIGRTPKHSNFPWGKKEEEVFEEFKRESIPYIDFSPQNDWQWLALAQHNRLPTRLLDWTQNPLAALWFAVKKPAKDHHPGVVWAFYYADEEAVFNTAGAEFNTGKLKCPFSINRTYVYFPEHVSPFIQAQAGVFTVHHRQGNNPGIFPPLTATTKHPDLKLTKIEIVPNFFPTICYHLFKLGIHSASLFPGLEGIVDKIRYDNMRPEDE